jgi:hypothetical protein
MFRVSTLPFDHTPRKEDGTVDFNEDFFGRATNLTVSGQLEGELGATASARSIPSAPLSGQKTPIPPATWRNSG